MFVDKEEIGSEGNTGMQSCFLEDTVIELMDRMQKFSAVGLRRALRNSKALSADVEAALDPTFKDVHDPLNAAKLGYGVVITKFTGHGGKYNANDAHAEFVGEVRRIFDKHNVPWQVAELGKVDMGGGGTVAKFMARYNMDVLDCGPALLSMHSPFEIASKADVYASFLAYHAFFEP